VSFGAFSFMVPGSISAISHASHPLPVTSGIGTPGAEPEGSTADRSFTIASATSRSEASSRPAGVAAEPLPISEAAPALAPPAPAMPADGPTALVLLTTAAPSIEASGIQAVETRSVAVAPSDPLIAAVSTNTAAAPVEKPAPNAASAASPTREASAAPALVAPEQAARTEASPLSPRPQTASAVTDRGQPPATPGLSAAALVARGDRFLGIGDVATARLFYERAVDAGDGQAALRLGETFDPLFLKQAHLRDFQADTDTALSWYRRARELGVRDAEVLLKR